MKLFKKVLNWIRGNSFELEPLDFDLKHSKNGVTVVIYNDEITPMEFVVQTLVKFLEYPYKHAVDTMVEIHTKGKIEIFDIEKESAEKLIHRIKKEALNHDFPLLCEIQS